MLWSRFQARALPSLAFLFPLPLASLLLAPLLLTAAPARAAPPVCAPDIVGPWSGKVWDEGKIKDLDTHFSIRDGALSGTYHVHDETGGYDGTLTDFSPSGPCDGLFHWHDRHGDGVVSVHFRPDKDRFDGEWGTQAPVEDLLFNGRRFRPAPTS